MYPLPNVVTEAPDLPRTSPSAPHVVMWLAGSSPELKCGYSCGFGWKLGRGNVGAPMVVLAASSHGIMQSCISCVLNWRGEEVP